MFVYIVLLISCSGKSGSSGDLSAFSKTCEQTSDTQAGLDCILEGFKLLDHETVTVPSFQAGTEGAASPSITASDTETITISSSNQLHTVQFDWDDPYGQTPAFCLQLCSHGVCSTTNRCTHGKKDGFKNGRFTATATWSAAPPNNFAAIDTKVTPVVSTDGSNPIQSNPSGGYYLPGLNVVSIGAPDAPPSPNPPTKTVTAGAPLTTSIIINNPLSSGGSSGGSSAGGGSSSGGGETGGATCVTVPATSAFCSFSSCSDGEVCYYKYNNKQYPCSSCGSCVDAAAALLRDCI